MLFNSFAFIFGFLPVTAIVFFTLTRFRLIKPAIAWLTVASLFFYSYWNISYLPLLLISLSFNYFIGRKIERTESKSQLAQILLWLGIIFNLGLLGYYKYARFFAINFSQFFWQKFAIPEIILPLAISFYTFTQIAYLVDAYRGKTKDYQYNLLTYSLFVCFFPQLIAGPILRYDELLPQFRQLSNFNFDAKNVAMGLTLFILGLSKKVAIADNLSPWVAPIFNHANDLTILEAWIGALSYTFQLYFDFSGYSDMAIGLGWMFNISLPVNFNSPYKAISIIDFWRRWHITLSNFLRDYLYIPLGGNRQGRLRQYVNLMITMLLGGLWHGAGWTFVIWGGLHGLYLVINHLWRRLSIQLPQTIGWLITFIAVVASWVLFRAQSLQDSQAILTTMFGLNTIVLPEAYKSFLGWLSTLGVQFRGWQELTYIPSLGAHKTIIILIGLVLCVTLLPNTQQIIEQFKPTWRWSILMGCIATFCLLSLNRVSEFLYFQF
ncbi:MBOAT family O-acyltransferase [Oscillatoria salina]|uniref:MBOAT family O-acyltransferase n=1 Tax=Oscillatoria salina TaxID=331517 RepID=UPI0013B81B5B|nr:MBOAT family protein [Oscillatoria salina]MBZ8182205.1 MBOAT family protein [Oscillatoria salina IIICB1]NET89070.1 MBOAT family protein [Kamptonema sp. SIO1D9]